MNYFRFRNRSRQYLKEMLFSYKLKVRSLGELPTMERVSFFRQVARGFADLRDGLASLFWSGKYPPFSLYYDKHFGIDKERLASDWRRVGDDMRNVVRKFEKGRQKSSE